MTKINTKNTIRNLRVFFQILIFLTSALNVFSQEQKTDLRPLLPGQIIECEMTGAEIHRYKFDLKKNEFFQVRIEQKGIDVKLKLLDLNEKVLSAVDSPNFAYGSETLSFVAIKAGSFTLNLSGFDTKAEKGIYVIKREASREATANDKQRVLIEKLFAEAIEARDTPGQNDVAIKKMTEAITGWQELKDDYLQMLSTNELKALRQAKANVFFNEGVAESNKKTAESWRAAISKFEAALEIYRVTEDTFYQANCFNWLGYISYFIGELPKALEYYGQALVLYRASWAKNNEAITLGWLGDIHWALGNRQKALEHYEQALPLYRLVGDKNGEYLLLLNTAYVYFDLDDKQKSLDYFNQSLAVQREINSKLWEVTTLINIGNLTSMLGENEKALEFLNQALNLSRTSENKYGEGSALSGIATAYELSGNKQKALEYYLQALPLQKDFGEKNGQSRTLLGIGNMYLGLGNSSKASEFFEQVVSLYKNSGDKINEAKILIDVGMLYWNSGENRKSLDYHMQALPIQKEIGDPIGEGKTLSSIGSLIYILKDNEKTNEKALAYLNQALILNEKNGDKSGEAATLTSLGTIYQDSGNIQEALKYYDRALLIQKTLGDKSREISILTGLGKIHLTIGNSPKAVECFEQILALQENFGEIIDKSETNINNGSDNTPSKDNSKTSPSRRQMLYSQMLRKDVSGEVSALSGIGTAYFYAGEPGKALDYFNKTLALQQSVKNKIGEAGVLNALSSVYWSLGEKQKALDYSNEALAIQKSAWDKAGEATTLGNIGSIYLTFGEPHTALEYFSKALPLRKLAGDKIGTAATLHNIASAYITLEDNKTALTYLNEALLLRLSNGDKRGEASTLAALGVVYGNLKDYRKALEYYYQALAIHKTVRDPSNEASILGNLRGNWQEIGNFRLAVYYGKLSINKYQELRGTARSFDNDIQKSFLRSARIAYEKLAELLIMQGKPDQAVQVLNLYQDQQFFDSYGEKSSVRLISFSPREAEFTRHSEKESRKSAQINAQIAEMKKQFKNGQPDERENTELQKLEVDLKTANVEFSAFLKDTETEFNKPLDEKDTVPPFSDFIDMKEMLSELTKSAGQKTAAIYTLIGIYRFRTILITSDGEIKHFESPIEKADFDKKVLQFYALLQSPTYDPRPLGRELYEIILKPVEAELKKQNIRTLMWQLDGNLRYIPVAALFDGENYLVERFQNVVFTRINKKMMTKSVRPNWTGTAFGNSEEKTIDLLGDGNKIVFPALQGVVQELQSIFRKDSKFKTAGILDGEVFSDNLFTQSTFYEAMKKRRPLVHISSHFVFRPGDDTRSFLVLGDGFLTLNEMKKKPDLFKDVDLLTLSACNTAATRADANGKEIDGFAELAQRLGASSVIATLWQVSDASTPLLMKSFYSMREGKTGTTKAEALVKAQLGLLNGTMQINSLPNVRKGISKSNVKIVVTRDGKPNKDETRGTEIIYIAEQDAPLLKEDRSKPFKHPFYWSPFILYGNWR